ncbi:hypothetical protein KIPB_014966 [Kipferlia bialata]|uniref:Uncharacterized protein n=1 Tax=Kipferlia bialata TaxID=797122 RepID=A0A9K3D9G4_9EUKA|nr:hypothetical protein KIPB_014966 [Kipferlia bialata]|eukprot:g14966.t1
MEVDGTGVVLVKEEGGPAPTPAVANPNGHFFSKDAKDISRHYSGHQTAASSTERAQSTIYMVCGMDQRPLLPFCAFEYIPTCITPVYWCSGSRV